MVHPFIDLHDFQILQGSPGLLSIAVTLFPLRLEQVSIYTRPIPVFILLLLKHGLRFNDEHRFHIVRDTLPLIRTHAYSAMAPYVYKPLDHSMRAIRVLRLFYSPAITDEVHCGIIETGSTERAGWADGVWPEITLLTERPESARSGVHQASHAPFIPLPQNARTLDSDRVY